MRDSPLRAGAGRRARIGACVVDLATGETVYEHGADEALNPASNVKLFVAAAALRRLGAAFTAATVLLGTVDGDAIRGDIVLRGRGDPTLRSEHLWAMARRVRARGLVRVTGGIVVDDSYFDDRRLPHSFDSRPDEDSAFRSPVGAASVDANAIEVFIGPGPVAGTPAVVASYPVGFLAVTNEAVTTPGGRNALRLFARASGDRTAARVWGSVGVETPFAGYRRRIDDPVLFAGTALREALAAAGVEVASSPIRRGPAHEGAVEIARHVSEPLGAWLRHLGKESSNFHAEQLLRILGAEGKGAPGAAEAGAEVVLEALAEMGVDTARISIRNGSGLYDGGRAPARAVAAVLAAAYADPRIRPEFLAHLSIAGVDGTAGTRMRGSPARGLVRAKTGTLAGAFALSGYVLAPQGHGGYAFSTIVNDAAGQATAARNLQDSIVRALADHASR